MREPPVGSKRVHTSTVITPLLLELESSLAHACSALQSLLGAGDSSSHVFMYVTAHSGEDFMKFQDWEEMTNHEIANAIRQMHELGRCRGVVERSPFAAASDESASRCFQETLESRISGQSS